MGRELRRVPITNKLADHPMRTSPYNGREYLQPMYDSTYDEAIDEWIAEYEAFKARTYHLTSSYCLDDDLPHDEAVAKFYAEQPTYWGYAGGPPDPEYYRPAYPEGVELGIQLWEDTSEGTPLTEAYPDTDAGLRALCDDAARNATTFGHSKTSAENWYQMLSDGIVFHVDPSIPGAVFL